MSYDQLGVVPCHRSKCMFCKEGVVYDITVERIIGHYWCDIDAYSPGVNCTPDGCYYYKKEVTNEQTQPRKH